MLYLRQNQIIFKKRVRRYFNNKAIGKLINKNLDDLQKKKLGNT